MRLTCSLLLPHHAHAARLQYLEAPRHEELDRWVLRQLAARFSSSVPPVTKITGALGESGLNPDAPYRVQAVLEFESAESLQKALADPEAKKAFEGASD
jgi:hypothetical protein